MGKRQYYDTKQYGLLYTKLTEYAICCPRGRLDSNFLFVRVGILNSLK